ncbi:hypothetical protein [Sphingobacterium siyangense]|uniref:hypothetical protein n=1 Tax=Sphingobacterium siyangense TaxID=459529 RepID=UPI001964272D|nr:hypothetical protein [Sphingobacterium siyangense]QRY57218.1 hypothetical protein JVX97_25020 [Sphingobacterium siyangense]
MKKKQSAFLIIALLISLIILGLLYFNFKSNKAPNAYLKQGGFNRKVLGYSQRSLYKYELKKGYYNIVGILGERIIIHECYTPNLTILDSNKANTIIKLPSEINPNNIFAISINPYNSSLLDIECGNDGKIFTFDISTAKLTDTYKFNFYFEKPVRASKDSFYCFVMGKKENLYNLALVKFDPQKQAYIVRQSDISKVAMTDDGIFQKNNNDLIYVNYYNNNIMVIDSSFAKVVQYKTIDTITTRPKTVTLRNGTITKFLSAPRPVNQLMQTSREYLFINSYVKADNDDLDINPQHPTDFIDVYDMNTNYSYKGTIYLDRIEKGDRMQSFFIQGNKLIAQYSNCTVVYELNF